MKYDVYDKYELGRHVIHSSDDRVEAYHKASELNGFVVDNSEYSIDWRRFKGQVLRYLLMDPNEYRSGRAMLESYVDVGESDDEDVDASGVERWLKPAVDQPTEEQRLVMARVMDLQLENKDDQHFVESLEGDYMMWDIYEALLTSRLDEAYTATDWWYIYQCAREILDKRESMFYICDEDEGAKRFEWYSVLKVDYDRLVRPTAEKYKDLEDTIFNKILC